MTVSRSPSPDPTPSAGREAARGATGIYLAEAIALPTGIATTAFLSYRLGPASYGHYALVVSGVTWLEVTLAAVLAKATVRLVARAEDWRPVAATSLRVHLLLALPLAAAVWFAAGAIADALAEPALGAYLRLFAIDIPLFAASRAHRRVLVGRGEFQRRAFTSLGRWTARLVLIVVLVECGLSVEGALLGGIGATIVELCLARIFVRPRLLGPGIAVGGLLAASLPLFLFDLGLRAFHRLGLFGLQVAGGDAVEVGCYGAALNLTVPIGLVALALAPVLLSTMTRRLARGEPEAVRLLGRNAVRWTLGLFPLAGLAAGASPEIVDLILARGFGATAPLVPPLVLAATCLTVFSVSTAILIAMDRSVLALALAAPMVLMALAGLVVAIPTWHGAGAAIVTLGAAAGGAAGASIALALAGGISFPIRTLLRIAPITAAAWLVAAVWSTPGAWVVGKLGLLGIAVLALLLLGELTREERARILRSLRAGRSGPGSAR